MKSPPQPTLHVIPVGASLIRWLETERQPPAVCRALLPGDFPQATNPGQHVRVELVRARGNDRVLNLNTLLYRREAQSDAALSALSTMPCDACAEWNALNRFRVEFGAPARPNRGVPVRGFRHRSGCGPRRWSRPGSRAIAGSRCTTSTIRAPIIYR